MTKKSSFKRIMAVVVTALMLVAFTVPAFALAPNQPNTGKITVHKYSGAGYGYETDSEFSGEAVTGTDDPAANGYTKLPGVGFTLYSLNMSAVNARIELGDTVTGYTAAANVVTFTFGSGSPTTLNVTGTAVGSPATTNADGEIVFGGSLADGYYVLVETAPLTGYDAASPSVIRVPLTTADGALNYDIHVYPKNVSTTNLTVKKLGQNGAEPISNGDVIPFELLAKFKNDEASPNTVVTVNDLKNGAIYGKAQIVDTMHADLVYQEDTAVYWMASNGTLSTTALAAGEYTAVATGATGDGGRVVTVTLTNAGIDKAIAQQYPGFGIKLTAQYTGAPSAAAAASNVTNKMSSLITKAGSTDGTPEEVTVYAPQLQIIIDKVDDSDAKMEDVEFMLLKTGTPTVNYVKGTSITDSTYSAAQKTAIAAEYVTGANGIPVIGTTDTTGKIVFSNIPGYADASGAEFWIKETKTNEGFQLKTALIKVEFEDKATYAGDSATEHWFDDAGNWKENVTVANTVKVVNYAQGEDPNEPIFSLPLTGRAGTIAFTVAGIVVMLGAAILIVRKRKDA